MAQTAASSASGSPHPARTRRPPVGSSAHEHLQLARHDLAEAMTTTVPAERYAAAHRGALHTTAAVLAVRTRPAASTRPRSAWALLPQVAPELSEWAAFFAAGAGKRAAAEAGLTRAVSAREADDLLRETQTFLALVETTLGIAHQPVLPHLAHRAS
jgi:HEPN superfamily protein